MCNPCNAVNDKDLLGAIVGVKEAVIETACVTNSNLKKIDCDVIAGADKTCATIVDASKDERIKHLEDLYYGKHHGCGQGNSKDYLEVVGACNCAPST